MCRGHGTLVLLVGMNERHSLLPQQRNCAFDLSRVAISLAWVKASRGHRSEASSIPIQLQL